MPNDEISRELETRKRVEKLTKPEPAPPWLPGYPKPKPIPKTLPPFTEADVMRVAPPIGRSWAEKARMRLRFPGLAEMGERELGFIALMSRYEAYLPSLSGGELGSLEDLVNYLKTSTGQYWVRNALNPRWLETHFERDVTGHFTGSFEPKFYQDIEKGAVAGNIFKTAFPTRPLGMPPEIFRGPRPTPGGVTAGEAYLRQYPFLQQPEKAQPTEPTTRQYPTRTGQFRPFTRWLTF